MESVIFNKALRAEDLGLASGFAVLMILVGGFIMAIGYGTIYDCLNSNNRQLCWNLSVAFGFYIGAGVAILGTVMLVGGDIARLLGKLRGRGPA